MAICLYTHILYIFSYIRRKYIHICTICSVPQNLHSSRLFDGTDTEQIQKKMTAPGLAHRKRSGETNPFEVNVSNAFEHYITWGLALPYPILKVQVI